MGFFEVEAARDCGSDVFDTSSLPGCGTPSCLEPALASVSGLTKPSVFDEEVPDFDVGLESSRVTVERVDRVFAAVAFARLVAVVVVCVGAVRSFLF